MKVNLNKPMRSLDGSDHQSETLGKVLATYIVSQSKGDALKMYSWAMKLYEGKELELDKADFIVLRRFVEDNEQLYIISKAQILEVLGEFKE